MTETTTVIPRKSRRYLDSLLKSVQGLAAEAATAESIEKVADLFGDIEHEMKAIETEIHAHQTREKRIKEMTARGLEAIADSIPTMEPEAPAATLDQIAGVLSGQVWTSDTLDTVARLVRESGRPVADHFHADAPAE